jgi:ABC-type transport system involved in multi-copper enzyme maturation permease subunit
MNPSSRVGFLGRTFGWSGSRREWLVLFAVFAWLATGYGIHVLARKLALGESILLYALWLLAFGLVARDAVRNLFGPVFFHDVVRTGRQRLTFVLRGLYATVIGFTLTMLYMSWLRGKGYFGSANFVVGTNELSRFGTEFFITFIVMQFIVVVLLTPVYVAGTICVDKERKILEFLFATDLRNREIIFGKLASRVLTLLLFVLVGLPILAFVQLFGGVDPEQVLACTVATIVSVIGLSSLGIWYSTMLKKARDAIMLTYLSYIAYILITAFAAGLTTFSGAGWWNTPLPLGSWSFGLDDVCHTLATGNIVWHLLVMTAPRGAPVQFVLDERLTSYCVFWFVASALLLGHAILVLRAVALRQAYGSPGGTRSRKKAVADGTGAGSVVVNEATRQLPPVGANPMLWKEVFVDSGARGGWMARVLFGLIALAMLAPVAIMIWFEFIDPTSYFASLSFPERWHRFREGANMWIRVVTGILTGMIVLAAAVRGAGAISGEKDKDTWISLLGTPMTAEEILRGKFWGCALGLRRVYFFLLLLWSIALVFGAANPFTILLDAALLALYVAAFTWIGLYCSMTARTTLIATVRAFFAAIFCAGGFWLVILLCCCLPLDFMGSRSFRDYELPRSILLGMTPPFVAGWLPMYEFDRNDLGAFSMSASEGLGIAAPIIGTMVWVAFAFALMVACQLKFRQVTNRVNDGMGERPRRRRPPSDRNRYD